jgi:hypothetical protein
MDQLPSLNLDELMKLDASLLEINPCSDDGIPFIEGLDELLPLSPKSPIVAFDPIISLPGMVPQPNSNAFHSSQGSGAANSEEAVDPTFHIEEEDGEEEDLVKPKRKPRGGRAAASGPPKDPKERIRAKNRRAQARYREKQKALRNGTSEILEQTTADLQRLRLENSQLLSRNQIMENVLVVRDHSVGILEKSKEAEEKMSQPGGKLFSTADPVMKTRFQRLVPSAPGTCSRRPGATTTTTTGMKNGAVSIVEVKDNNDDEDHDGCNCPLANATVAEMIAAKATMNEVVQQRYKIYAERLADALTEMEDPRSSSHAKVTAEESMTEVLWETGAMCFESAILEPTVLQKLLVVSVVDDDTGSDVVKAAKWAAITAKLNLTDAQRQKMQPIREVFLQRAARIAAERKQLLMDLHTATTNTAAAATTVTTNTTTAMSEEGEEEATTTTSLHSLQDVTTNWLGLHDKTRALEANLMEEHLACMELVAKCFGGILTPLQKSKAIVESYPAFPDIFAIATAAAVEHSALPAAPGVSFSGAAGSEVNKVLAQ